MISVSFELFGRLFVDSVPSPFQHFLLEFFKLHFLVIFGSVLGEVVVIMHVNSDNVDHDLSDEDVDDDEGEECNHESIHSDQILN